MTRAVSNTTTLFWSTVGTTGATAAVCNYGLFPGRLTLTAGSPIMNASVTASNTIRYTSYSGALMPYLASNGTLVAFGSMGELTQLTTDATKSPAACAANSVYDMFLWNDAGTLRCTRGPAWTTTTTRSLALGRVMGLLCNSAAITNGPGINLGLYVGTIATNATSTVDWILGTAASGGGAASLMVYNYYNRVNIGTRVVDSIAPYTYSSATIRQAGGSATNQINYVSGAAEDSPFCSYQQTFTSAATGGAFCKIGIGDDSITTFETMPQTFSTPAAVALTCSTCCNYQKGMAEAMLGIHYFAALEASDGVNLNTFNVGSLGELTFNMMM